MSKRDEDSGAHSLSDMEAGMTTAERRRRRRRGGGLRVPSDNVPRRTTTPPVVAPVPEGPSHAMSIAYSFKTNDTSDPVPRVIDEPSFSDPVAPDAVQTVIDPPSAPVEAADFEMKTREMTAVDLEALGLTDPSPSNPRVPMHAAPVHARVQTDPSLPPSVEVDVDMSGPDSGPTTSNAHDAKTRQMGAVNLADSTGAKMIGVTRAATDPGDPPAPPPAPTRVQTRERLKTMALSEEDLEEVREAVRAASASPVSTPPKGQPSVATGTPPPGSSPLVPTPSISSTQPLSVLDIEPAEEKPQSLAEIDLADLEARADSSGEFEVDVDDEPLKSVPQAAAVTPPPPPPSADRKRAPSHPPPFTSKESKPDLSKEAAAVTGNDKGHTGDKPHPVPHGPPPPPPAAAHAHPPAIKPPAPPAPPPKVSKAPSPPPQGAKESKSRGKPWFVDLFDEDYLRTLPFLTPQATQAEAEFVIDSMGLQPGAQVLDVGCGYGRHAMELAARGFHVVGLDLSTPLLVRGGEEAMRRGLEINFVRGDMRELDFDSQFDGAYCMFSTFGYFDDETNKKTIANIARALKPGGRVMIEILNRDYVIADLPTRVWWEGEGCVVLEEVELNYFSSRIQVNRSVVFDDGRQLEQEISVRAYSLHEVGKLMHAAGFRVLEVSGGYQTRGRFFGNQSRHIIVLAERKDPAAA